MRWAHATPIPEINERPFPHYILDNQPVPNPDVQVTDEWITSSTDIHLGGGLEFRRGEGKIVGVFGAEAGFLYRRTAIDYDYGNPISQVNPQPSATFWSFNNNRYERQIEVRRDRQFGAGLNGFIGVEYFFAPKISLGAEFLLGVSYMQSYRDETTYEYWDTVTGSVQTRSAISEGGNFFQLETGNYGGSINLMFYF